MITASVWAELGSEPGPQIHDVGLLLDPRWCTIRMLFSFLTVAEWGALQGEERFFEVLFDENLPPDSKI